jgi:hypothetical protein
MLLYCQQNPHLHLALGIPFLPEEAFPGLVILLLARIEFPPSSTTDQTMVALKNDITHLSLFPYL